MIGYTFLAHDYWGHTFNKEVKSLMINHAFQFVDRIYFQIGKTNLRSQKAIAKLGAEFFSETTLDGQAHVIFKIDKVQLKPSLFSYF